MDDPGPVSGVERVSDLLRDGQSLRKRQRAPAQAFVQRVAVDQLEHQGRHVAGVFETVDCPDVRMIERCEQLRFAFEEGHAIGVRREPRRQELQRDVAAKLGVVRPIHLPHTASAQQCDDLIRPEFRAQRLAPSARNYSPENVAFTLL